MLKFYNHAVSWNTRRVWIALLEKEIEFEEIRLQLNGDQMEPDFLEVNPFHHAPALIDNNLKIIESLAILDYLEAKYPKPALLPTNPQDLAIVRMVEMISANELAPAMAPLIAHMMAISKKEETELEKCRAKITTVLTFFSQHLDDNSYFTGESLTRADIVAGTIVPWLPSVRMNLDDYPRLQAWCDRLSERPSWQKTEPSPEAIKAFRSSMKKLMKKN